MQPFHSEMRVKDAIARELLDFDDEESGSDSDCAVDARARRGSPSFLNEERETAVDILTGDAE